jgi:phosphoribosylglycinamide formyltransferase-1
MMAMLEHQAQLKSCGHSTVVVLADRQEASGLNKASSIGIPSFAVPLSEVADQSERRHEHEERIHRHLEAHEVELILLSGYMRLLTPAFVSRWSPRIINIHPSLLPAFPGAHAHCEVLESQNEVSGCTVHYVDEGMDTGQILAQSRVPVFSNDTEKSLSERVKIEEHRLYPSVVDSLVRGDFSIPEGS